jgi:hypothetical protein
MKAIAARFRSTAILWAIGGFLVPDLLDVVEFRVATDSWESGTVGTVVELSRDRVLVEVSDAAGRTLDPVSLPRDAVKRLAIPEQERLRL